MSPTSTQVKFLAPRNLPAEEPNHAWSPERLGAAASAVYADLLANECSVTAAYWLLGQLLHLARKHFNHGQWGGYLREHKIDKNRAAKALRIFARFSTVEKTAGLTVTEAYEQSKKAGGRKLRKGKQSAPSQATKALSAPSDSWPTFIEAVHAEVERRIPASESLIAKDATSALAGVLRIVAALGSLEAALRKRVAACDPLDVQTNSGN